MYDGWGVPYRVQGGSRNTIEIVDTVDDEVVIRVMRSVGREFAEKIVELLNQEFG